MTLPVSASPATPPDTAEALSGRLLFGPDSCPMPLLPPAAGLVDLGAWLATDATQPGSTPLTVALVPGTRRFAALLAALGVVDALKLRRPDSGQVFDTLYQAGQTLKPGEEGPQARWRNRRPPTEHRRTPEGTEHTGPLIGSSINAQGERQLSFQVYVRRRVKTRGAPSRIKWTPGETHHVPERMRDDILATGEDALDGSALQQHRSRSLGMSPWREALFSGVTPYDYTFYDRQDVLLIGSEAALTQEARLPLYLRGPDGALLTGCPLEALRAHPWVDGGGLNCAFLPAVSDAEPDALLAATAEHTVTIFDGGHAYTRYGAHLGGHHLVLLDPARPGFEAGDSALREAFRARQDDAELPATLAEPWPGRALAFRRYA
ncbi:hypothetical protein [Deinococcus sonorensis]|uniref:Uncharacterized protein n=2 Tax=Deinococcus sonorensis TaxID=309891 RepID=A0AAU7UGD0_9DEIO